MISQEEANELNKSGASVLCVDVPPRSSFGIDCKEWQTGEKFKGVKMIPPGIHYIHSSPPDTHGTHFVPRLGFFASLDSGGVLVRQWQAHTETLEPLDNKEQEQRLKDGVKNFDFDANLGPYPFEAHKKWLSLSSHINQKALDRLQPSQSSRSSGSSRRIEEESKEESAQKTTDPYRAAFTKIPTIASLREGLSPSQLSEVARDRSEILRTVLEETALAGDVSQLLAEFQFAFVLFSIGQTSDAFDQWSAIIELVCHCCDALEERFGFYLEFIDVLLAQLKTLPSEFLDDLAPSSNFLARSFQALFSNSRHVDLQVVLRDKILALHTFASNLFPSDWKALSSPARQFRGGVSIPGQPHAGEVHIDGDDESDDEQPVIVEL